MSDLDDTYQRLAKPWTHEQLADHYRDARDRGAQFGDAAHGVLGGPIAAVASAIPPSATISVAIHMLHALPATVQGTLPQQLLDTAERNAADALQRCHRALELDGDAHEYAADEWLPAVYDIAATLLSSARADEDPPILVRAAQDAISWLSRAVAELDRDSPDAPSALAETLARLLTIWVFAGAARQSPHQGQGER